MSTIGLPIELWLQVFSYLDYFDLKQFLRVCKTLSALLDDARFDATLFRRAALEDARSVPPTSFKPHPALASLLLRPACSTQLCTPNSRNHAWSLSNVAHELATVPAVTSIALILPYPTDHSRSYLHNDSGVTMSEILECIDWFFRRRLFARERTWRFGHITTRFWDLPSSISLELLENPTPQSELQRDNETFAQYINRRKDDIIYTERRAGMNCCRYTHYVTHHMHEDQ